MFYIFLLLCGEDEYKRPRSKKLIHYIKEHKLSTNEYKIIISGRSSFFYTSESAARRTLDFFIKNGFPKENFILEEESLDTLGNMIFSFPIIQNLIINLPEEYIKIILITEKFHLRRSKKLFQRIFKNLVVSNKKIIKFDYIGANNFGIPQFFLKRKAKIILKKILKNYDYKKDLTDFFSILFKTLNKEIIEFIILDIILTDIDIYRLNTIKDFKDYLFSLPVYNQMYKPSKKIIMELSLYAKAIDYYIKNR